MRVRKYFEGQSFTATVVFLNSESVATSPDTARYRIDCLTTGRTVRDWTSLTVASSVDIAITPDDNAIQNQSNRKERRQLVIQTNYGEDDQGVWASEWEVQNLQGIT